MNQADNGEYVRARFLQLMKKPFVTKDQKTREKTKILIIGDSHAQDFLNSIFENKLLTHTQISTRYIPTRCQIVLGKKRWIASDKPLCEKSDTLELARSQIKNADVIILAAFWRKWAAEALPQTINNLELTKDQRLYIIGRRSFSKSDPSDIKKLNTQERINLRLKVDKHQIEINNIMKNTLDEKVFINTHLLICGQSSTCPAFTDDLKMISFDGGHLSKDGARYFGHQLFQKSKLRNLSH